MQFDSNADPIYRITALLAVVGTMLFVTSSSSPEAEPHVDIPHISLEQMQYLEEARAPDDDWTGLTLRRERKKRQNRLNQRAFRNTAFLDSGSR